MSGAISNVSITSDGTPQGSRVTVDGIEVTGVARVEFDCEAGAPTAVAIITVYAPTFDGTFREWTLTKPDEKEVLG